MTTTCIRRIATAAAAAGLAAIAVIGFSTGTASAGTPGFDCASDYDSNSWDSDKGIRDRDVQVTCYGDNGHYIQATWRGYGEHLFIDDHAFDGQGAQAWIHYIGTDSEDGYEWDELYAVTADADGTTAERNLDLPEDVEVGLRVCTDGTAGKDCTEYVYEGLS